MLNDKMILDGMKILRSARTEMYQGFSSMFVNGNGHVERYAAVAVVLDAFDANLHRSMSPRELRRHCIRECRRAVGFSIDIWFMIGKLMLEIIPILWSWWVARHNAQ